MTPLVSVVVPCHDYGRYLREAVESVLAQDVPLELLIVDDGSTDDSLAIARSLAAADPRVDVLAQACSGQPAIARNNGIARTSAPYVLCLDADDGLQPGFLRACLDVLESEPSVGVAYGDQQDFGGDLDFHVHAEYDFRLLTHQNFIGTASVFRRAAWEAAGGYATNVRGYEDWDFWIACGEHGFRGRHVPAAIFDYRVSQTGLYADALGRDHALKAGIVLNHPRLYTSGEIAWAHAVQAGMPVPPTRVLVIPVIPPTPLAAGRIVAASAAELARRPELLVAYAESAPPGTTLVLHVDDPQTLETLAPHADAVAVAVAVVAVTDATEADLALQASAVLSAGWPGPLLDLLPRFEPLEVAA